MLSRGLQASACLLYSVPVQAVLTQRGNDDGGSGVDKDKLWVYLSGQRRGVLLTTKRLESWVWALPWASWCSLAWSLVTSDIAIPIEVIVIPDSMVVAIGLTITPATMGTAAGATLVGQCMVIESFQRQREPFSFLYLSNYCSAFRPCLLLVLRSFCPATVF